MLLKNKSSFMALGGVCCALSLVFLLLASSFPASKRVFLFGSSVITGLLICAGGNRAALVQYIVVSVLSVFFVPGKLIVLMYVIIFGNYPMLKKYIESIEVRVFRYAAKFILYNLYLLICYIIAVYLLRMDIFDGYKYSLIVPWFFSLILFIIYDIIYMPFVYKVYNLINKI